MPTFQEIAIPLILFVLCSGLVVYLGYLSCGIFQSLVYFIREQKLRRAYNKTLKDNPYQESYLESTDRNKPNLEEYGKSPEWEDHFKPIDLDDHLKG